MKIFDAFLTIGRTNQAISECPCTQSQVLELMDRYNVQEALVVHTVARDSDPESGNAVLSKINSRRLHRVWAFDPAYVIEETPEMFLERALRNRAKAIMVNPLMRDIRLDRSKRLLALAKLLEQRRIPFLVIYRAYDSDEDVIDWYMLSDFCKKFPQLPVLAWQWRTRANRPMFDALAETKNLIVSLSSIWQAQMVEQICQTFGPHCLVFSLGLPSLDPGAFIPVLSYADISEKAKLAIADGNIRKILREARYDF